MEKELTPIGEIALAYYRSGAHKTLRFGQFYINKYKSDGTAWPELFYETDSAKAMDMIMDYQEKLCLTN